MPFKRRRQDKGKELLKATANYKRLKFFGVIVVCIRMGIGGLLNRV
jgi:hypothetical protein